MMVLEIKVKTIETLYSVYCLFFSLSRVCEREFSILLSTLSACFWRHLLHNHSFFNTTLKFSSSLKINNHCVLTLFFLFLFHFSKIHFSKLFFIFLSFFIVMTWYQTYLYNIYDICLCWLWSWSKYLFIIKKIKACWMIIHMQHHVNCCSISLILFFYSYFSFIIVLQDFWFIDGTRVESQWKVLCESQS
jgi:hypothetical protein